MKPKILVVDDDENIRELITFYLEKEGFEINEAANGKEALELMEHVYYDLLIVDVMMPVMDGFTLIEQLDQNKDTAVIMLTAKHDSKDKLNAFSKGVDDYVTKPFIPEELIARVKAIMKRCHVNISNQIQIGPILFDGDKYEIIYNNNEIHLPLKQFEIVFELAKKPDQIFSRELLLEKIWGLSYEGFDRTIDVHIKRIRENLKHIPEFNIVTSRGLGYKLEVK